MKDLTVIFLTINRVPEKWARYHRKIMLDAIWQYPLITVSRLHMKGVNLIQKEPFSPSNIYFQMLRAAKLANTPFVAIYEDDTVYPREHFTTFRPPLDTFAYNNTRWSLALTERPMYQFKDRMANLTLIAPRQLLIQCLEERFKKYPHGTEDSKTGEVGKEKIEQKLGLPHYKAMIWNSNNPIVNFETKEKPVSRVRAFDIPYWGRAEELIKNFQ